MESNTFGLVVLILLLVVTRPFAERAWRAGRISDRAASWLVVGRLPVLGLGFGIAVGRPPLEVLVLAGIGLVAAFLLQPVALRRLVAVKAREPGEPPAS